MEKVRLRTARISDAAALLAIYAPYVRETAITFEYDVPDEREFAARIRHVLEKFPYLVAEADGEIVGYAYAGAFHPRAAYQWCAEMSVYVKRDARRMGIGKMLYTAMEEILRMQRITNAEACIAMPNEPDEHLTLDSVRFHERMGLPHGRRIPSMRLQVRTLVQHGLDGKADWRASCRPAARPAF